MPEAPEPTLYRKYRPQTFAEVSGQDHVVRVLTRACMERKTSHAYLFAGPRGTGKTTIARLLAKRLNCTQPKGAEPCGTCAACVAVASGAHLDVIEIDAASNRGIDDIRSLKERIRLQPAAGEWKVYILDEVHMLSKDAANALLKTLEEPPPHAIFILATTELEKVIETVRSRCQTFIFRRVPAPLIVERLQKIADLERIRIAPDALRLLASAAGGCFRDAESLLAMVAGASGGKTTAEDVSSLLGLTSVGIVQDFVDALLQKDAAAALAIIRTSGDAGASFTAFTETLARTLRALASTIVAGTHAESYAPDEEARLQATARQHPVSEIAALLRLVLRAKYELRDAIYQELPLELLTLEWCGEVAVPKNTTTPPTAQRPAIPVEAPVRRSFSEGGREAPASSGREDSDRAQGRAASEQPAFEKVLSAWPAFLRAAASLHPLLRPMLRDAVPLAVRDGTLFILTEHSLAHDRLKDPKFRHPLEEKLSDALGEKLQLRLVRSRDLQSLEFQTPSAELRSQVAAAFENMEPESAGDPAPTDILNLFGGEVIDKGTATP